MKKFLFPLILILLALRIYPALPVYTEPFDKEYWYGRYYVSQWFDPVSKNPISDAGLYKVAGYDLATTHTFFKINPEVPPLGKYIYGYSILAFQNAEVASLIMYIMIVLLFYLLAGMWTKNQYLQTIATGLLIIDPLVFDHARDTLLDLPQLIGLLLHMIAFLKLFGIFSAKGTNRKEILYIILAGISLGIFISTKFAFLSAVILFADLILFLTFKKYFHIIYVAGISALIYILAYGMYFIQGNSLKEFLGTQKWILTFYLDSNVIPVYGTVFTTLLIGLTKGWHDGATWERVKEWSLLWSYYLISSIFFSIRFFLTKKLRSPDGLYLLLLTGGLVAAYVYLPFFTRYLILLIPLMILLSVKLIEYSFPHIIQPYRGSVTKKQK
jgi:hypothetical protein